MHRGFLIRIEDYADYDHFVWSNDVRVPEMLHAPSGESFFVDESSRLGFENLCNPVIPINETLSGSINSTRILIRITGLHRLFTSTSSCLMM